MLEAAADHYDRSRTGPLHPRTVYAIFLGAHVIFGGAAGGILGSDGAIIGAGAHGGLLLLVLVAGVLALLLRNKQILYAYMAIGVLWIIFGLINIMFILNVTTIVSSGKAQWVGTSVENYYIATGTSGWASSAPGNATAATADGVAIPFVLNSCPPMIGACMLFLGFGLVAAFFLPVADRPSVNSGKSSGSNLESGKATNYNNADSSLVAKSPSPPEYRPSSPSSRTMALLEGADPDAPIPRQQTNYQRGNPEPDSFSRNRPNNYGTGGSAGGLSNYGSQTRLINNRDDDEENEDKDWPSRSRQQNNRPANNNTYGSDRQRNGSRDGGGGGIYDNDALGTLRPSTRAPVHMASRARDTLYTVNGGDDSYQEDSEYAQSMARSRTNYNNNNDNYYSNNNSAGRGGYNNGSGPRANGGSGPRPGGGIPVAPPRSPASNQQQQQQSPSRRDRPDRDNLPPFQPTPVPSTPSTPGSGGSGGGGGTGTTVKREPKVRCRTCGEKMLLSLSSSHVCPDGSVPAEKYGAGSQNNGGDGSRPRPQQQQQPSSRYADDRYNDRDRRNDGRDRRNDDGAAGSNVSGSSGGRYGGGGGGGGGSNVGRDERPAPGKRMRVIKRYSPKLEDEIYLEVDDIVKLEEVFEDGWGAGHNETSGDSGAFPLSCLGGGAKSSNQRVQSMYGNKYGGNRY